MMKTNKILSILASLILVSCANPTEQTTRDTSFMVSDSHEPSLPQSSSQSMLVSKGIIRSEY